MLTFFHAPRSRSSRLVVLMDEMGILDQVEIKVVNIPRQDGSGARDPANPHPEGKVPALLWDEEVVTETPAIIMALGEAFPDTALIPKVGDPRRAAFLTWMVWYSGVMEPVLLLDALEISHPALQATVRGPAEVTARIAAALAQGPYLLGAEYTAADLLIASPYAFYPDRTPDVASIRDWSARCQARASVLRAKDRDTALIAG